MKKLRVVKHPFFSLILELQFPFHRQMFTFLLLSLLTAE